MDKGSQYVSQSLDLNDVGCHLEYLGPFDFVEIHEFQFLVTHTAILEEQFKNVTANLMQAIKLL